jgi:hypothetical protein
MREHFDKVSACIIVVERKSGKSGVGSLYLRYTAPLKTDKISNMRIYPAIYLLLMAACCACQKPERKVNHRFRDYVTVGKMMDTIKPPYIVDAQSGSKHVILIGCDHNRDPEHPQVALTERYFNGLKPQLTFNEGGQVADSVHFVSLKDAASKKGETGMLKYLSDRANIKMMDGDMADSAEFKVMLKKYSKDRLLLYYVMERMVIPYLNGAYGTMPFDQFYTKAIKKWFVDAGFPLNGEEQKLAYFKNTYRKYVGHNFELKMNIDIERFDYINGGNCEFCALGRASKMIRDSTLLRKIDDALNTYDRILVTFGQGHALAIEPALQQMVAVRR